MTATKAEMGMMATLATETEEPRRVAGGSVVETVGRETELTEGTEFSEDQTRPVKDQEKPIDEAALISWAEISGALLLRFLPISTEFNLLLKKYKLRQRAKWGRAGATRVSWQPRKCLQIRPNPGKSNRIRLESFI